MMLDSMVIYTILGKVVPEAIAVLCGGGRFFCGVFCGFGLVFF